MPGLIRWRRKRSLVSSAGPFARFGVSLGVMGDEGGGEMEGRSEVASHNQPETDNGKEWARSRSE